MSADNINQLIAALADNSAKMKQLLARNLETEFGQVEGYVGASKAFVPCPKLEGYELTAAMASVALRTWVVSATCYVQKWRFFNRGSTGGLWVAAFSPAYALQIEFDNDINFPRPVKFIAPYTVSAEATSYTANTGGVQAVLDVEIPVRYRHARLTVGLLGLAGGIFASSTLSSMFGGSYTALYANAFGE